MEVAGAREKSGFSLEGMELILSGLPVSSE
jgi:hypothetical protein